LNQKLLVLPTNAAPDEISLGAVLEAYAAARASIVSSAATMAFCIERLADFWGDLTPVDVDEARCRAYTKTRAAGFMTRPSRGEKGSRIVKAGPGTVRRELGVLQSALKHAKSARILSDFRDVHLPAAPPPRERALSRQEAAWLLLAAAPHVRRFIVLALYTGRRASAILELGWKKHGGGGWVDVQNGEIDFRPASRVETKKRRGAIAVPRSLLAHIRRWHRRGGDMVIEWRGRRVAEIDTAFLAACRRAEALALARGVELDLSDVSPHTLKHTSVAWFFERGGTIESAVSYYATSAATLQRVYRKHSPAHQKSATDVWDRRR